MLLRFFLQFWLGLAIVSSFACNPEEEDDTSDTTQPPVVLPTPSTLKLSKDFNALVGSQTYVFSFTDVNGVEQLVTNPAYGEVDSVDFALPVLIQASAGNNLGAVVCNWNLKKDGVVIDVQTIAQYVYTNE